MYGIGAVELIILIALAVVLFGAPVLTFIMGYAMGKRSSDEHSADKPAENHAQSPESDAAASDTSVEE